MITSSIGSLWKFGINLEVPWLDVWRSYGNFQKFATVGTEWLGDFWKKPTGFVNKPSDNSVTKIKGHF